MTRVVIFASAPAQDAVAPLSRLLARHASDRLTIFVRDRDRAALTALLADHEVRSDKPPGGRLDFVRSLRAKPADLAIGLWLGHDEYWPAKALFWLCRARTKLAVTERSADLVAASGLAAVTAQLSWRRKHRVPSPYGRGGLLRAALRASYRATLGRVFGAGLTLARYLISR